jgi:hypothetical protein
MMAKVPRRIMNMIGGIVLCVRLPAVHGFGCSNTLECMHSLE